jgi:hypothetical protein
MGINIITTTRMWKTQKEKYNMIKLFKKNTLKPKYDDIYEVFSDTTKMFLLTFTTASAALMITAIAFAILKVI